MAKIIKNNGENVGMKSFLDYFNNNMLNKKQVTKEMLDHAWFLLYERKRSGGSCSSCLINVYNMLKDVFDKNYKEEIVEIIIEEEIKEEISKPKKKKSDGYDFETKLIKG